MMKALFVTATAQTLANFHTIKHLLDNGTTFDNLVIITTDHARKNNWHLQLSRLLTDTNPDSAFTVEMLFFKNGIEEHDVTAMEGLLLSWITEHDINEALFNITGGTKLISIAQDRLAQKYPQLAQCVYQSMGTQQLAWYGKPVPHVEKIASATEIEIYLKAYGYTLGTKGQSLLKIPARLFYYVKEMERFLQEDFERAQKLVSSINYHACQALEDVKNQQDVDQFISQFNKVDRKRFSVWLNQLSALDEALFDYDDDTGRIVWHDAEDVAFCKGNWFELLVAFWYFEASNYQLRNIHVGLEVRKNNSPNEADVAFVHKGVFYFVECKTNDWKGKITEANRTISHIDSTGDMAGISAKKLLVSLFNVDDKTRQAAKVRNVRIIAGKEVLNKALYSQSVA